MNHERLAQLMQALQEAMVAEQGPLLVHMDILSVLVGLDHGDISSGQAIRHLTYQALLADQPAHATLYRQAATAIRQMQQEEQEHEGHA